MTQRQIQQRKNQLAIALAQETARVLTAQGFSATFEYGGGVVLQPRDLSSLIAWCRAQLADAKALEDEIDAKIRDTKKQFDQVEQEGAR